MLETNKLEIGTVSPCSASCNFYLSSSSLLYSISTIHFCMLVSPIFLISNPYISSTFLYLNVRAKKKWVLKNVDITIMRKTWKAKFRIPGTFSTLSDSGWVINKWTTCNSYHSKAFIYFQKIMSLWVNIFSCEFTLLHLLHLLWNSAARW